jgi:putative ABC transport system permease protein
VSLLCRACPGGFRRRHGAEVLAAFEHDFARARTRGTGHCAAYCVFVIADLSRTAVRLRLRQAFRLVRGDDRPSLPRPHERTQMDMLLQDVRYALRQFAHRPAFAAIAVLSLALAIGGNSLIYGIIDGFVLHPFAYPEPDRLVSVGVTFPKISASTGYVEVLSPAEYADIRTASSFARTTAFDLGNRNISGGDMPERVFTALVLDDPFPVVGMKPVLGRGFTHEELAPNGPRVAIISHRLWQTRFGGDPRILDRPIRIGGETASVVGVMPPGLVLIGTDLWIPWGGDPLAQPRNQRQFTVLARLKPDATISRANADLSAIAGRVASAESARFKEYDQWSLQATPWASALLQDVRPAAFMLLIAVGFVLLIACANLTNLFLARSTTRQREIAVRLALGAARLRLARHLITESMLLAIAGAAGGLLLAAAGMRFAARLIPAQFRMLGLEVGVNLRVFGWSALLAIAAGLLVGLLPAVHAIRTDPHDSLKADGRAGASRGARRVRHALVVGEIALSVVLFLGAGLLVRSVSNIRRIDTGFEPRGVLTMRLTLPREKYPDEAANVFFDRLTREIGGLPGTTDVAAASQFPAAESFATQFALERGSSPDSTLPNALITVATPAYFRALRVPVLTGRAFSDADKLQTPKVAIVNEAFVRRYLGSADAVGSRIAIGPPDGPRPWTTIVGVVADYRNSGPTLPVRPEIVIPVRQQTAWNQLFLLIRSATAPESLVSDVRRTITAIDPEQPVYLIQTLDEALATTTFQQRTLAVLLSVFASVALVLAAIGVYGVMAYSVSARTQEMGVRLAIGAQRRDVAWLVLRQAALMGAAGVAIGVGFLLLAGPGLERLLYGVTPADPATMACVAGLFLCVALVAAWSPASRASRVDPIEALRYE